MQLAGSKILHVSFGLCICQFATPTDFPVSYNFVGMQNGRIEYSWQVCGKEGLSILYETEETLFRILATSSGKTRYTLLQVWNKMPDFLVPHPLQW